MFRRLRQGQRAKEIAEVVGEGVQLKPDSVVAETVAGDAALIFDPDKTEEIAEAISRLWTDAALRKTLPLASRTIYTHKTRFSVTRWRC